MRFCHLLISFIVFLVMFSSCQRELYFDGVSSGKLDCPVQVNGIYKKDSVLSNGHFIEMKIKVAVAGSFEIRSDSINGYSFKSTGNIEKGEHTIRLPATGKPTAKGANRFTIVYGEDTCYADVTVMDVNPAVFTLLGNPGICTGGIAGGVYTKGTSLTFLNTLTVQANVSVPGTYHIVAESGNGFQFVADGIFTAAGAQPVVLTGTGTPFQAGTSHVVVSNVTSSCSYDVNVLPPFSGTAVYTFNGAPNACLNYTVNGIFAVGAQTISANTAVLAVNVTTPGSYIITTNSADGISFSGSGTFLMPGPDTVTLTASGAPVNTGSWAYIANTGAVSSCNFVVNVQPPLAPALFTLEGSPGNCIPGTVYGNYAASVPLNPANTVAIQVNVVSGGTYSLTTNTANGISFSAAGVFLLTGLQTVTLRGSGTPQTAGITTLTPSYSGSACKINVNIQ